MVAKIEPDAAAQFDAEPAPWEARARDIYLPNRGGSRCPSGVSASHILFAPPRQRSRRRCGSRRRRARSSPRAADFNAVARERPTIRRRQADARELGAAVSRGQMDPAASSRRAFALPEGRRRRSRSSTSSRHLIRARRAASAAQADFRRRRSPRSCASSGSSSSTASATRRSRRCSDQGREGMNDRTLDATMVIRSRRAGRRRPRCSASRHCAARRHAQVAGEVSRPRGRAEARAEWLSYAR